MLSIVENLVRVYQLHIVVTIACIVSCTIVYIIVIYEKKRVSEMNRLLKEAQEHQNSVEITSSEPEPVEINHKTIKKSISFNTIFNLEEFMVRLYKIGFLVRRIKTDGTEKERFISIDRNGNICFHKLASPRAGEVARRQKIPYFRLSIKLLNECFICEESPIPSFIMDFTKKTLHLAVASKIDRDYIVKGIRLIVQRAMNNSSFLLRSSSLLESASPTPTESIRMEEDDEYDDNLSQTTMNTAYRR